MTDNEQALIFNISIAIQWVCHDTSAPRKAAERFTPVDLRYHAQCRRWYKMCARDGAWQQSPASTAYLNCSTCGNQFSALINFISQLCFMFSALVALNLSGADLVLETIHLSVTGAKPLCRQAARRHPLCRGLGHRSPGPCAALGLGSARGAAVVGAC